MYRVITIELHLPYPKHAEWVGAEAHVKHTLLGICGGYNEHSGNGLWRDSATGELHRDRIRIIRSDYDCRAGDNDAYLEELLLSRLESALLHYLAVTGELCLYVKIGDTVTLFSREQA
jgi:hypothetical protein